MSITTARVLKPELMDDADAAEAAVCLRDIARINRWFGGHRVLVNILRSLLQPQERFTILDVGAASGDMGRVIRNHFPGAIVVSLDYRPSHLRLGQGARVAADAFQLPFLPRSFDFILCSLFLHHFSDGQAAELIAALRRIARRALIVLDLERHPVPYYFLPATRRLLRWSPMTVHDGVISVAAAFRPDEIRALAQAAGGAAAQVRRHLPWFRLSAIISAEHSGEEKPAVPRPIGRKGGTK
jgi:SAM-dependent methyltransferase